MKQTSETSLLNVSQLLGAPVRAPAGERIGKVRDVVAHIENDAVPIVNGIVVRCSGKNVFVPWPDIAILKPGLVELNACNVDPRLFERRPGEILLNKDLCDSEVVDLEDRRVVRANDVTLRQEADGWVVAGVDVGIAAILSQFGLGRLAHRDTHRTLIPWNKIEMFVSNIPVALQLTHGKIARLHPADIARIFHRLGYRQSSELIEGLPDSVAADVVEEMATDYQSMLLSSMNHERAVDILQAMPPEAAADLLNDMDDDNPARANELLTSMRQEQAAEVERLRTYPDNTAGGMMTNKFVTLKSSLMASKAIEILRNAKADLPAIIDPILVTPPEDSHHLAGIISLRTLLLAGPDDLVEQLMQTKVVVGHVGDNAREVTRTIAHYNLMGLPILDHNEKIAGIVQISEAMDLILPHEWRRLKPYRFPG